MSIQAVRGMKDVLPPEVFKWQKMEKAVREIFRAFGFSEIKIPVLERTELFARSIGETTDIVEKEMYTFSDRSGDSLTMRPEATAGVLRAYVEHKMHAQPGPHKLFAIGPMFRHERPQKGRLRQFNQIDAEILGDESPLLDAELMVMLVHMVQSLGLSNVDLHINSLGCSKCRPKYRQALIDFFEPKKQNLCEDCLRRLNMNPLRVLDCKVEGCKEQAEGAPVILDHICDECSDHFAQVRKALDSAGVKYKLDPRMVRGLDYYVRTTFEVVTGDLGAQNAVAGGGRYDGLIEVLGGPPQGGIGFAAGFERLALLAPEPEDVPGPTLFVAALGEKPREEAFRLIQNLRRKGIWAEMTSQDKSLKAQMRRAGKLGSAKVLILGENELEKGEVVLKNMQDGSQENLPLAGIEKAVG